MAHFDHIALAPADPILGLTDAFKADSYPDKINLGVGVFINDQGITPVLNTVAIAEKRLAEAGSSKSYLPITGFADYLRLTQDLCFGQELCASIRSRIASAQTPGGTGALRVAGDFIAKHLPASKVWVSNPTWANHQAIFAASGIETPTYRYFNPALNGVDFDALCHDLENVPANDVVLLHACCHNPTGADLSPEQWITVAKIAQEKGWIPFLDFAYQGFGSGIHEDAIGLRSLAQICPNLLVAQSFSKNFGLYQERIGALHVLSESNEAQARVLSQIKVAIRSNYSNPPAHGGAITQLILSDPQLYAQWDDEVAAMRERIHNLRRQFVDALKTAGVSRDFSFLCDQNGMFSFTGIAKEDVQKLRDDHHIYMVSSGRINVAGITSKNIDRLVASIKAVLG